MKRFILSSVAGALILASMAHAHHSIAGAYDTSQKVSIEGTVSEFHFVNPHPYVLVDVKRAGSAQLWRLEMDNRSELAQVGMTAKTLKPGDRVVVTGSPSREQPQGLYIQSLDRPADGFRYEQVGNSPKIRTHPFP